MKTQLTFKVITKSARAFDADGYEQANAVEVADFGDTIAIGATEHSKSDLLIASNSITSKSAGWSVTW